VEKKNRDPFSFQSSARLLFSCNGIPQNCGDRSEGVYRRLIILRFNRTVPEDKRDPNLLNKFRQEADGIFLFALEGLRRLIKNRYRFSVTQTNLDELQRYREESDSVLAFVRDCCELNAAYMKGSKDLYQEYASYCQECGMKPYALRNFVHQIIASFPQLSHGVDTSRKARVIKGIKLK
jgi:putative DNA primase/helicase